MRVAVLLLLGCTRAATPAVDAGSSPLDGCIPEKNADGTTYSCGSGFLAMDATIKGTIDQAAIKENLDAFAAPFEKDIVARDDATFEASPAVRLTMQAPDSDKFFAMMVVLPGQKRVLTCSAKASDAARCETVIRYLMRS